MLSSSMFRIPEEEESPKENQLKVGAHDSGDGPRKRPAKTALHQAVLDCRIHQVRLLLDKHGASPDSRDVFGLTPLMLATLLDNEQLSQRLVKLFFAAGVFLNVKDNLGRTALMYACMKGRMSLVTRFLLDDSIDLNAKDNEGNTALMYASLCGFEELVYLLVKNLIKYGMSVNVRNIDGYTALLLACKYGNYHSAHILLLDGHASPTLRDNVFFFNALEWVKRSRKINNTLQRSKSTSNLIQTPRFGARENTMYNEQDQQSCHHCKSPSHPLGGSISSTLHLPAIFDTVTYDASTLKSINDNQAYSMLVADISNTMSNPSYIKLKELTSKSEAESKMHPSSAKLRSVVPRKNILESNIKTIMRLYSEHYKPVLKSKQTDLPLIRVISQTSRKQSSKTVTLVEPDSITRESSAMSQRISSRTAHLSVK